ncbi:terminase large subunit [Microbacterium phage Antuna]|nr:terminase large subunit [Microbacterium phage Antuna]
MTVTEMQQFRDGVQPLSRKQRRFIAKSTARVNLMEGSIRSSKTYAQFVRWGTFIANDVPNKGALVIVGKTMQSIYRNLFEPLDNDPGLGSFRPMIQYRQGAPTAMMFGRTCHVIGAADAKAESKIRGFTVAGALVDEVTTIPEDAFKQLLGRMSPAGARLFGTTNPDAPMHWLRRDYLLRLGELRDWYVEHFTMDDNPSLTDEYRSFIEQQYRGVFYDRFIRGMWVAAEGAIYDMFDPTVGGQHVIHPSEVGEIERVLCVGVDYGTTHATRGYMIGLGRDPLTHEYTLYVLAEFAPGKATVGQHAAMFREWLAMQRDGARYPTPDWIAVDPAAAVFRQQLFDDGVPDGTGLMRAHNSVLPGIQTVQGLFAVGRLKIVGATCPHLVEMLPGYRWDSAAAKRGDTKPIKENDDEADALRYAVYSVRRFWREFIPLAAAARGDDSEPVAA